MSTEGLILTHYGEVVDLTRTYDQQENRRLDKPRGLWLSDENDYGWSEWCDDEQFRDTSTQVRTDFRFAEGANILHLATPEQLVDFTKEWGLANEDHIQKIYGEDALSHQIDWVAVAGSYDGILITPYHWSKRLEVHWYYGWDVASACVWNLDALVKL